MEEHLHLCSPGDKGPPPPTSSIPALPPVWAGSHLPQQRSLLGSHSLCALHFEIWFLREATASSLVFFESFVFSQLFLKPFWPGSLADSFPKLPRLSAFFPPTVSALTLHHLLMQILSPSYEFVSLLQMKKAVCVIPHLRVALESGHRAQAGLVSSILEFHINRITQYILFVCGFFWSAHHLWDSSMLY